jgi:hypothetical protein
LRHSNMANTAKHHAAFEQGAAGRVLSSAWRNTLIRLMAQSDEPDPDESNA